MNWPYYPLSQLAERFISGGTPNTKIDEYWHGNISWITGADFDDGEIILGRRFINQKAVNNSATNIVPKGSILIVTRTGVGKIAIAPADIAISQDITGVILKCTVSAKYLIAAIRNKMAVILTAQRGATIKGVTRKDVENLRIPLPPPSEQRRIAEILDQADQLRKLRVDADAKARRILPALFIKMFGDPAANPMGWKTVLFAEVAEIGTQLVDPNHPEFLDLPHIGGEHIEKETGRILSPSLVKDSNLRSNKFYFSSDHILLSKIRPYLNKVAYPRFNGVCSADIYPLIPKNNNVTHSYLVSLLRTQAFLDYAKMHSDRLRIPKLNKAQLGAFEFPLPDTHLILAFDEKVGKIISVENFRFALQEKIETLYQVILHRAFTGDLTASWRKAHMKELLQEMEIQAKALAS